MLVTPDLAPKYGLEDCLACNLLPRPPFHPAAIVTKVPGKLHCLITDLKDVHEKSATLAHTVPQRKEENQTLLAQSVHLVCGLPLRQWSQCYAHIYWCTSFKLAEARLTQDLHMLEKLTAVPICAWALHRDIAATEGGHQKRLASPGCTCVCCLYLGHHL